MARHPPTVAALQAMLEIAVNSSRIYVYPSHVVWAPAPPSVPLDTHAPALLGTLYIYIYLMANFTYKFNKKVLFEKNKT
jgi:hypothetical protein